MYVFAKSTCVITHDGAQITVRQNTPWYADDPVVEANPDLFQDHPVAASRFNGNDVVEAATNRPGEKRSTRRAR